MRMACALLVYYFFSTEQIEGKTIPITQMVSLLAQNLNVLKSLKGLQYQGNSGLS